MERNRKQTPGRFLRRNTPYFLIALVLVLIVVTVIAAVRLVRDLNAPKTPASPAQTPAAEQPQPAQDEPPAQEEPAQPADPNVYVPPFDGRTILVTDRLAATYDEDALQLQSSQTLVSFTAADGAQTSRVDVQKLDTSLTLLKDAELERICTGALQAYYYAAPATQDITLTVTQDTLECFEAQLQAQPYGGAPAVEAQVRLLELDGAVWCVSAIYPDGEDCTAQRQTFASVTVLPKGMKLH